MSQRIPVFRSAEGEARYYEAYNAVLKQWPVFYQELYIPTSLGSTHIIASGKPDAPPLMLLHPSGAGAVIWQRNIGAFTQHFRTYAVDTIGEPNKSILTQPIKGKNQRKQYARWFTDLVDGLNIERTNIVGNSFGGFLTLNSVLHTPDRIRKAVLISPAATFVQIWSWILHFMPSMTFGLLTGSKRAMLRPIDWIWQNFPADENIAKLRTITALEGRPRHRSPTVFSDKELNQIQTPILLLIGGREVIYNPAKVIEVATRKVHGLRAEIIPNANHNAEYTAPEAINNKIIEFLKE
jgi:pimeloyl-ACP methyl ester carboxylesterase